MKKFACVIACFVLLSAMAAWAGDNSISGWIVDEKCGAKAAHAGNEACTKKCLESGAKPVFVTDNNKDVLNFDNPGAIKGHEGHHVKITGSLESGALHVDNVEMLASNAGTEHQH